MLIERHRHHLPHWEQGRVWQFITWRLADSIPAATLAEWKSDRDAWMRRHPEPWDAATEHEYHKEFSTRLDDWLDAGHGACVLRTPAHAKTVADALRHFEGARYTFGAFVIMPNHVHVLFLPDTTTPLADIIRSWKGYTAMALNRRLGKRGQLWQEDYWDRIIRNQAHYDACARYIIANPAKARLGQNEYILYVAATTAPRPQDENTRQAHPFPA
ncbi:MAG: transposase [Opitutaceae bacterium]|nr:transposase [Opitutaceae bacterium]